MGDDGTREVRASRRMLEVAEWELQQILLNIHDGPVQYMYAALSQLDLLRRALADRDGLSPEAADRLDRIRSLLESGLGDVRSFIGALRSPEFEARDLATLLRELVIQHEANTDTEVEIEVSGELETVPLPVRIGLYRVLQEALSNAYRHGGARRVSVSVEGVRATDDSRQVRMVVADDGAGFRTDRLEGGHFGLRGMRDRMEVIGGQFDIVSAPGEGTRIAVEVPV